jgi:para-aminobenzoate synthetase component I
MTIQEFRTTLNKWSEEKTSFFFCVDFELKNPIAWRHDQVDPEKILFSINKHTNVNPTTIGLPVNGKNPVEKLTKTPVPFSEYEAKFNSSVRRFISYKSYRKNKN